ncbi:hypothetical protein B0H14DRAFT_3502129 [Mycena olivaceomarginata]|nr:hypothetical protein B0H14DRAFT_3502129 [Mycena olivaceomarginata]
MVQHLELRKLVGDGKAYDVCASTDCPYLATAWFPNADWEHLWLASQIITFSFVPVGEAFAFRMTKGQRKQILDELNKYLDACEFEQLSELSGQAPTMDEYL